MSSYRIIDLFSGCGGLSTGFVQNGCSVEKALEYDPMIASTYQVNHPDVPMIIDDIKNVGLSDAFADCAAEVIIGGPPCQGFSMAGARIRSGFIDDPRNYLFKHYFNVVKTVKPKVFVMENVKGIMTMQNGQIFQEILRIFSSPELLGDQPYKMWYKLIKAVDFGVPQQRERMILIGTRLENADIDRLWALTREEIQRDVPSFFDKVTVYDAISDLPPPNASGLVPTPVPMTPYQQYLAASSDVLTNHTLPHHEQHAIERMRRVKSGENYTVLNEDIKSVHSGSYGRLSWDEPSRTVTTRFDTPSGGRFIHPTENRTLTPREAARLQSFPDSYVFRGNKSSICRQIGNAVPPKISYFLARLVEKILTTEDQG
ncbi:MAG: DNA cytosine methyltransferase [Clostridia bacterium]|nr:DNA cytosine methyltransferase [Clostridia bacterium]